MLFVAKTTESCGVSRMHLSTTGIQASLIVHIHAASAEVRGLLYFNGFADTVGRMAYRIPILKRVKVTFKPTRKNEKSYI